MADSRMRQDLTNWRVMAGGKAARLLRLSMLFCGAWLWVPVQAAEQPWSRLPSLLNGTAAEGLPYRRAMQGFYAARDYRPLWFSSVVPRPAAAELVAALRASDREGLDPAAYQPTELRRDCLENRPEDPVRCELRLTTSLLHYAEDVAHGMERAADLDPHWHIPQASLDAVGLLQRVSAAPDLAALLDSLPPVHTQYRRLRQALAAYRARQDEWFTLAEGPSLRPGVRSDRVLGVRERLGADEPALLGAAEPAYYDEGLVAAVKAFQARHGLDVDGIVGTLTRAAMNIPLEIRIQQIRLNMERWRWLPRELGDSHVLVNLAGFDLALIRDDVPVLQMRAISGRPDRTSPSFQSRIRQLVINPPWNVPRRLAVKDLLPMLQRDPRALQAKQIEVLQRQGGDFVTVDPETIDWSAYHEDRFPFLLRQRPGVRNSLGRLKFVMPNPFEIYIHDTPAKGLFQKSVRTFSSGCIRVEKPQELALQLLSGDREHNQRWIQGWFDKGQTEVMPVEPDVPVYLVYLTAWVDGMGNFQFRNDVYGRDGPLMDRFSVR